MKKLLLGVFLSGCAWTDGRKREINLHWLILWSILGGFYLIVGLWGIGVLELETELLKRISGISVGILLLAVALISRGQIGIGDGLVFLVCGLFLDFWESSILLMGGLFLLMGRCLIEFFRENRERNKWRNKELPLIPYVFAAYIGGILCSL